MNPGTPEEVYEDILHTAARVWIEVEDPDMREGIALLAATLLIPEVGESVGLMLVKHAMTGARV